MIELFTEQYPLSPLPYQGETVRDLLILSQSEDKNIRRRPVRVGLPGLPETTGADWRGEFLIFLFLSSVWGWRDSRAKLLCKAKYENIQIHEDRKRERIEISI